MDDIPGAEHKAVLPPFDPAQDQSHGPPPVTAEAVPASHSPVVGMLLTATPLALPHAPLISRFAEHDAVVPAFEPAQVQPHGPLPATAEAVPALHRLVIGALVRSAPFEAPHTPFTAVTPDGASVA